MNVRNRYLLTTIRTLLGLLLIFSGVSGFLAGKGVLSMPPPMVESTQQLWEMGIFQMIKVTEIVAGLMLVTGFLPALAAIFIAPLGVGIMVYNSMVAPGHLGGGVMVCVFNSYLGYAYWDKYKALFTRP